MVRELTHDYITAALDNLCIDQSPCIQTQHDRSMSSLRILSEYIHDVLKQAPNGPNCLYKIFFFPLKLQNRIGKTHKSAKLR